MAESTNYKVNTRLFITLIFLSSCAPAGILATAPVHTVEIDGISHQVQEMPNTKNAWAASPTNLWGGTIDPADYDRNIRAIEKYTGCTVKTGTVSNRGLLSTALVQC